MQTKTIDAEDKKEDSSMITGPSPWTSDLERMLAENIAAALQIKKELSQPDNECWDHPLSAGTNPKHRLREQQAKLKYQAKYIELQFPSEREFLCTFRRLYNMALLQVKKY